MQATKCESAILRGQTLLIFPDSGASSSFAKQRGWQSLMAGPLLQLAPGAQPPGCSLARVLS